ncbi:MAG: hypothetical protein KIT10_03100 [Flavobacteriales bacterium]|nr:hypothetical protein [Flavobacteriales bacterium]
MTLDPKALAWLAPLFLACGGGDLCDRTFEPFPDHVTGRVVSGTNRTWLHAMELYREGDFEEAADSLAVYMRMPGYIRTAHLYLAMCKLAMDEPYEAELHLDHLRNSNLWAYQDQWEWYAVVCWTCSGQLDRALEGAEAIATRKHTYQGEAGRLVQELRMEQGR